MKTINLLPKEAKKSDVKGLFLNILFILFVIVFIAVLMLSVFLVDMNKILSTRISDYEMVNMRIQDDITDLRVFEDFVGKVDLKQELVAELERFEQSWHIVLMELSRDMPDDVYITYIEGNTRNFYEYLTEDEEGKEKDPLTDKIAFFTIEGYARDYNDVLRLAINIEDVSGSGKVWLNTISRDTAGKDDVDAYSFNITSYWDLEPYADMISSGSRSRQEDTENTDESILDMELDN